MMGWGFWDDPQTPETAAGSPGRLEPARLEGVEKARARPDVLTGAIAHADHESNSAERVSNADATCSQHSSSQAASASWASR
jgi:hypothetical protein